MKEWINPIVYSLDFENTYDDIRKPSKHQPQCNNPIPHSPELGDCQAHKPNCKIKPGYHWGRPCSS